MSSNKINSFNGKKRRHSILTSVTGFLEGLVKDTPVNEIGARKIVHCNFQPAEPVEIRSYNLEGRHHIKARLYGDNAFQDFYFYCHKDNFLEVMNYINKYCDNNKK